MSVCKCSICGARNHHSYSCPHRAPRFCGGALLCREADREKYSCAEFEEIEERGHSGMLTMEDALRLPDWWCDVLV